MARRLGTTFGLLLMLLLLLLWARRRFRASRWCSLGRLWRLWRSACRMLCSSLCRRARGRPHVLKARLRKARGLGRGGHLGHAVRAGGSLCGCGQGGAFMLHLLGVRAGVAHGLEAALLV